MEDAKAKQVTPTTWTFANSSIEAPVKPEKQCGTEGAQHAEHCWHYAPFQHSMMHHRDDICCHCGQTQCVSTLGEYNESRKGHGPFCP